MPYDKKRFLEFSKTFIDAANNVFETMIFTKIVGQKPLAKSNTKSLGEISAVMGITGKLYMEKSPQDEGKLFKGMLVISWPMSTYLKTASAMLMEEYSEYNEEISDCGAEISNMIMGNAKRDLKIMGYHCDMSIPSMIVGHEHEIIYPENTVVIVIPSKSDHGDFFIEICYIE